CGTWGLAFLDFPIQAVLFAGCAYDSCGIGASGFAVVACSGIVLLCGYNALTNIDRSQLISADPPIKNLLLPGSAVEVPLPACFCQRYRQRPVILADIKCDLAICGRDERVLSVILREEPLALGFVHDFVTGRNHVVGSGAENGLQLIFVVCAKGLD